MTELTSVHLRDLCPDSELASRPDPGKIFRFLKPVQRGCGQALIVKGSGRFLSAFFSVHILIVFVQCCTVCYDYSYNYSAYCTGVKLALRSHDADKQDFPALASGGAKVYSVNWTGLKLKLLFHILMLWLIHTLQMPH